MPPFFRLSFLWFVVSAETSTSDPSGLSRWGEYGILGLVVGCGMLFFKRFLDATIEQQKAVVEEIREMRSEHNGTSKQIAVLVAQTSSSTEAIASLAKDVSTLARDVTELVRDRYGDRRP